MFERLKKVISIHKDKLIAIEVVNTATKKFGKSFELPWSETTLDECLTDIVKKMGQGKYRILVSDDLSYVIRLNVPRDIPADKMRAYILEKIQAKVTDPIEDGEWDYRLIKNNSDAGEQNAVTFILSKSLAKALFNATAKAGIEIEAIEAETLAKTRDANAFIGIALKEDISGVDEEVLNIISAPTAPVVVPASSKEAPVLPSFTVKEDEKEERPSSMKLFAVFIFVTVLAAILGVLFFKSQGSFLPSETKDVEPTATAEPTATPSPKLDLGKLKVQIQNGSGVKGEADNVADLLQEKGFSNFVKTNATTFDFTDTKVSLKESAKEALTIIKEALNKNYFVAEDKTLSDEGEFDIVIIVGDKI